MKNKTPFLLLVVALSLVIVQIALSQPNTITLPPGESILACANDQLPTFVPPNRAICPTITPTPTSPATPTPATGFLETFDGSPATPAPWRPANWDITVHSRNIDTWVLLDSMTVQHGPECQPPPGTHTNNSYEGAVFHCNGHIMTALRASGYGVVYLTPNQLVDFSAGEAVIRFDLSTLRTSNRDWVDLWITPYEDNLQTPLEDWLPDLNGEPRRAVHIRMRFGSPGNLTGAFEGFLINDFEDTVIPLRRNSGYESIDGFVPSATQRQTFELRISQTHIKFGMPAFNFWWIDSDIAPLSWSSGVVQFGHHSYNPMKDCATCSPNTWHWDNVSISPAVPFTILPGSRRFLDPWPAGQGFVTFSQPAPAGAYLRFSGIGNNLEISSDGQPWRPAELQAQESTVADHFRTYWTPIPEGTTSVRIRGVNWWGGRWQAKAISIWAR